MGEEGVGLGEECLVLRKKRMLLGKKSLLLWKKGMLRELRWRRRRRGDGVLRILEALVRKDNLLLARDPLPVQHTVPRRLQRLKRPRATGLVRQVRGIAREIAVPFLIWAFAELALEE